MTLAQGVVAVAQDADWRAVAEALCAILLGLVAFMAKRVQSAVDAMGPKLDRFYKQINEWNIANVKSFAGMELRVGKLEDRDHLRRHPESD